MKARFRNPVLAGSYPDPSICRVGDDYYLVNSSFEFFPALPVHHSRDLVHWRCVGHVVDRVGCLDLSGVQRWSGVWAPTIRYHQGRFYVVWTDMRGVAIGGRPQPASYVATARDAAGPWSDPVRLDDPHGFDPSLFFDADGTAWYGASYVGGCGKTGQYVRRFDPATLRLVGEETVIWDEHVEGTHLYRVGDWYYLLAAAGGTGQGHSVVVARSRVVSGPYEANRFNPILTHRHLGLAYPISATGHADMVEIPGGDWWMVLLAKRQHGAGRDVCGRETFLVPVSWESGWPVVNPGKGIVEAEGDAPHLPAHPWPVRPAREDFDDDRLGSEWCWLRTPRLDWYDLKTRPGWLRLRCASPVLADVVSPAFRCRRLEHLDYDVRAAMLFGPATVGARAGVALYASERSHVFLGIARTEGGLEAQLWQRDREDAEAMLVGAQPVGGTQFEFALKAQADRLTCEVVEMGAGRRILLGVCDARLLSDERSWTSNGAWFGCHATGQGQDMGEWAEFDWIEYRGW